MPVHTAFKHLFMAIGPDQRQCADKGGGPIDVGALFCKQAFHLAHGHIPVAAFRAFKPLPFRPIRSVDARPAAQRPDFQSAIIRQSGKAGHGGGMRLDQRIFGKGCSGFFRFWQAKLPRGHRLNAIRGKEIANFAHLALIMAGNDQTAGGQLARHDQRPTA